MKCARQSVIAVLVAIAISLPSTVNGQQPRDQAVKVIVDHEVPPRTLDGAWKAAPIIIHVRVAAVTPVERRSYDVFPGPFTEARLVVVEVFKGKHLITEAEWIFRQGAGVADTPMPRRPIPLFMQSDEYVLFLERPLRDSEALAWADAGAWKLNEKDAEIPPDVRRMWHSREKVPREEVFATLRALRESRTGK